MRDKYALIPVGDEQEADAYRSDWEEHEALIREQAMGDPVFTDEENIEDLSNEIDALTDRLENLHEILDGYHKDMRCPTCGGPIEAAFTTSCWRCQQALEIENLRTQLWAYETPLSKVVKARLRQLWRRLR